MTTTTTPITGVDFVCVPTTDFERAVHFYGEVLGLPESARWGSMPAAEFETGSLTLAIMQSDAFGQEFRPHGLPIGHVGMAPAQIEALLESTVREARVGAVSIMDFQARSANPWERRTAIVATWAFIRQGQLDDTFAIGEILARDPEHFVQTAVGGWVREAGKRDRSRLLDWLDAHAAALPRTALGFAVEHLAPGEKAHYRGLRSAWVS